MGLFHIHQWEETIYIYPRERHVVRYCTECGAVRSKIRDVRTNKEHWVPYDLWLRGDCVYIVCDDPLQFQAIKKNLENKVADQRFYRLTDIDQIRGRLDPIVLFAGRWWEQDVVQDPRFLEYLNGGHI